MAMLHHDNRRQEQAFYTFIAGVAKSRYLKKISGGYQSQVREANLQMYFKVWRISQLQEAKFRRLFTNFNHRLYRKRVFKLLKGFAQT
jgi:regulatory protein YycI of two-component signal transduction system YycFG